MNIKEFYTVMSRIYLNQVILAGFFLLACLFIFHAAGFSLILRILFFSIAILVAYFLFRYLYFMNRSNTIISLSSERMRMAVRPNDLILMFLPAPSLMIQFFNSNGVCACELGDENLARWKWFLPFYFRKHKASTYQLKKRDGRIVATIKLRDHSRKLEIISSEQKVTTVFLQKKKSRVLQLMDDNNNSIKVTFASHKIEFFKRDKQIAVIQKGWMPISLQRYFSPNTPILTFQENLNETDQHIMYGLLILIFAKQYN
ncbi:hypothetical protein [Bacillus sp. FJAT-49736]|uniref:hypothetical protein n=1 Tax=Bacillus sp. FJAT-49736 TaxID=2833582 RepID=UPI001BC91C04|nr:hypothetical protein [Bacillus sp. FJAT-49736]MBS4173173.1 hypothetical protein [Bacillus sp. FJAT-49736]